jgi:hypothetical protein
MEGGSSEFVEREEAAGRWYDLFSRGARDWLRHNDKVREAVRRSLPDLVAKADILPRGETTVQVPVRFLEHAGSGCATRRVRSVSDRVRASPEISLPGPGERVLGSAAPEATRTAAIGSCWNWRLTTSSTGCGRS